MSDDADPEETSTQRSRRKRRELAAQESRGAKPSVKDAEEEEEVGEARAGGAAGGAGEASPAADAAPTWPEVAKALTSGQKELILTDRLVGDVDGGSGVVDSALWRCTGLNLLNMSLKVRPNVWHCRACRVWTLKARCALQSKSGERPLRSLSEGIARLAGMRTLILSNNALETLPDGISALTGLKALEVAFNKLASLPASFSKLTTLETLLLAHNQLTSVASLAGCTNLVSVTLDSNQLSQLDDAAFECKARVWWGQACMWQVPGLTRVCPTCAAPAGAAVGSQQCVDPPAAGAGGVRPAAERLCAGQRTPRRAVRAERPEEAEGPGAGRQPAG